MVPSKSVSELEPFRKLSVPVAYLYKTSFTGSFIISSDSSRNSGFSCALVSPLFDNASAVLDDIESA